jgi:hypothetical protein
MTGSREMGCVFCDDRVSTSEEEREVDTRTYTCGRCGTYEVTCQFVAENVVGRLNKSEREILRKWVTDGPGRKLSVEAKDHGLTPYRQVLGAQEHILPLLKDVLNGELDKARLRGASGSAVAALLREMAEEQDKR